jgi:hypothetical protein
VNNNHVRFGRLIFLGLVAGCIYLAIQFGFGGIPFQDAHFTVGLYLAGIALGVFPVILVRILAHRWIFAGMIGDLWACGFALSVISIFLMKGLGWLWQIIVAIALLFVVQFVLLFVIYAAPLLIDETRRRVHVDPPS